MSFSLWLRRDRLWPRFTLALRRGWRGTGENAHWWPLVIALIVLVPYIATWRDPHLIGRALVGLTGLGLIVGWLQWVSRERVGVWLAACAVLLSAWGGAFFLWLFLENPLVRSACLVLLCLLTWWYLEEWRRRQPLLALGGESLQGTPALVASVVAVFGFGVGAESLLVFLNLPLWYLVLTTYLPMLICFLSVAVLSNWSLVRHLHFLLAAAVVLIEAFVLITWWPTSVYVAGFALSVIFLGISLTLRQEAQGFFNRRGFTRELATLGVFLITVLLTARWF